MTTRERLHELVERLPEEDVEAALRLLAGVGQEGDPVLRALANAPIDDEPESAEERAAVEEGLRDLHEGNLVSSDVIRDEIG